MRSSGEDRLGLALETTLKAPWVVCCNVARLEKRPGNEPVDGEVDVVLAHSELGVKGGAVWRIGHGRWESSTAMATGTTSKTRSRR